MTSRVLTGSVANAKIWIRFSTISIIIVYINNINDINNINNINNINIIRPKSFERGKESSQNLASNFSQFLRAFRSQFL